MELRGIPLIGDDFDLSNYEYAILVKNVNRRGIQRFYGDPLKDLGLDTSKVFCFELYYQAEGRTPAADKREYLDQFLPILKENNFKHLLVADSEYFKLLSRERNSTGFYGETVPSKYPEYENTFTLTPIVNYTQGEYNSQALETIGLSCLAYCNNLGLYDSTGMLGDIILKDELYPDNLKDIEIFLDTLHLYPFISSDIETYSLVTKDAGLGTIGFAWDVLSGGSFSVEFNRVSDYSDKVKELLRSFFDQYRGKIYFHNAAFDVTKLIYQLYMKDSTDIRGMREGIRVFSNMVEDTQLIAYNCLNSTVKPDLSLKTLSKPFLGNYAEDVTDITLIPEKDLLTYNLKDCLGTLYVKNIYEPQMIKETAGRYYYEISKPSLEFIWEMQLVGLPIDLNRVKALEAPVRSSREQIQSYFDNLPPVKKTTVIHAIRKAEKTNASLVNKHHPFQAFMKQFNPGSNNQISTLLYDVLKLPVLNLTDTGNPSTNQDTIKQLLEEEHYKNELEKEILENLQEYTSSGTLMSTFIPGFLTKSWNRGGTDWVTSNYNLSGIVTGRISSSDMNLANLPSNSKFGNAVKYCFRAPKGWLLGGADFSALEEKVNAIRTNDPNRIAVYLVTKQYELVLNGKKHIITEKDNLSYDGKIMTGRELYEKITNS